MGAVVNALLILEAANQTSALALRAIEAAHNGDEEAARAYIAAARDRYAQARAAWDAA